MSSSQQPNSSMTNIKRYYNSQSSNTRPTATGGAGGQAATQSTFNKQSQSFYGTKFMERSPRASNGGISKEHFKNNFLMQSQNNNQLVSNMTKHDFNSFRQSKNLNIGTNAQQQNNLMLKQIGGDDGNLTRDKFQINSGSGNLSESVNGYQFNRDKLSKSTMNQNPMVSKLHQFSHYKDQNYSKQTSGSKLNIMSTDNNNKKEQNSQADKTQRSTVVLMQNSTVKNNFGQTQTNNLHNHLGDPFQESSSVLTAYQNQKLSQNNYSSYHQDLAISTQEQLMKKQKQLDKLKFTSNRKSQGAVSGQSMSQSKLLQQKYKKFLLDSNPSFANGGQNYGNQQIQIYDKLSLQNGNQVLPPVSFDMTQDSLLQQSTTDNNLKGTSNDGQVLSAIHERSKEKLVSRLEFNDKALAMHSSALKESYPNQFIDSSRNYATSQGPNQKPGTSNPFMNSAQQVSLLSTSNHFNQTQQSTFNQTTQQTKRNTLQQMALQQLQKDLEAQELQLQKKFHSKETKEVRTTGQEIVAIDTEFKTYFKSAQQFTEKILQDKSEKSKFINHVLSKMQECQERALKLNKVQKQKYEQFAQHVDENKPKQESEFSKRLKNAMLGKMMNPFGFKGKPQDQKMVGDYQFLKDAQEFLDEAEEDLKSDKEENQPKHMEEYPDFSGVTENLELYHDQIMLLSEQDGDIDASKEIKSNQEYFKVFQKGIMGRVSTLQHDSALQLLKRLQKNTTFKEQGIQVSAEDVLEELRTELYNSQCEVKRLHELLSANNQNMEKLQAEQTALGKKTGETIAQLRKATAQNQQLLMDKEAMQHDLDRYEQKIRDVKHNLENENKDLRQFLHETEREYKKFQQKAQEKEIDARNEIEEKQDIIDGFQEDLERMTKYKMEADEILEKHKAESERHIDQLEKDLAYSRKMSGQHLNKIRDLEHKLEEALKKQAQQKEISYSASEASISQTHHSHLEVKSEKEDKIPAKKTSHQRSKSNLSAYSKNSSHRNLQSASSHRKPAQKSHHHSKSPAKKVTTTTPHKPATTHHPTNTTNLKSQNKGHITSTLINTVGDDSSKQLEKQTDLHVEINQPEKTNQKQQSKQQQQVDNQNINQISNSNTQASQKENLNVLKEEEEIKQKQHQPPSVMVNDVDEQESQSQQQVEDSDGQKQEQQEYVESKQQQQSPDKIEEQLSRLEQDSESSQKKKMSQTQVIQKLDMDKIINTNLQDQSQDISPSKITNQNNNTHLDDSSDQIMLSTVNEQNQRMQSRMKPQLDPIRDSPERSMSIENIVQPGIKVKTSQRQSQNTSVIKETKPTSSQQKASQNSKRRHQVKDSPQKLRKDIDSSSQAHRSSRQKQSRNEQGAQTADEVIQKTNAQDEQQDNQNYQQVSNQVSARHHLPVQKNVSSQHVSGHIKVGGEGSGDYNQQYLHIGGSNHHDVRSIQDTLHGVAKSGRHSENSQFQSRMSLNQGHVYNASFKVTKPRYIHEQQNMHIPSQVSITQQHNAGAQTDSFMLFNYFMEFLKVLEEKIKDGIINPTELCEKKPDPFDLKFQEELQKSREKLMQLQEYLSKIRSLKNHGGDIFFNQLANTFMFNPVLPANHQAEKYNQEITSRLENLSKLENQDSQYLTNAVSTSTFIIKNRYSVGGGNYNNVHKGYAKQNSNR